jgi:hypothetical protein
MSNEFRPDFSNHFRRGNKDAVLKMADFASQFGLQMRIQHLFEKEGVTAFRFEAEIMGKRYAAGVALRPELHNEKDVEELAVEIWSEFRNMEIMPTIAQ